MVVAMAQRLRYDDMMLLARKVWAVGGVEG